MVAKAGKTGKAQEQDKGADHHDLLHARWLSNAVTDLCQCDMRSVVNEGVVEVGDDVTLVDEAFTC